MSRFARGACLLLTLVCGIMVVSPVRAEQGWRLDAADWARPRSGGTVVGMAPLPEVVRAWSAAEAMDIVILHAGGEEGELRAAELRDWLIALGVPGNRIRLLVAAVDPQVLQLELRP